MCHSSPGAVKVLRRHLRGSRNPKASLYSSHILFSDILHTEKNNAFNLFVAQISGCQPKMKVCCTKRSSSVQEMGMGGPWRRRDSVAVS